jgi:hypothetical protein
MAATKPFSRASFGWRPKANRVGNGRRNFHEIHILPQKNTAITIA